jgi:hypothetical protein
MGFDCITEITIPFGYLEGGRCNSNLEKNNLNKNKMSNKLVYLLEENEYE